MMRLNRKSSKSKNKDKVSKVASLEAMTMAVLRVAVRHGRVLVSGL